MGELPDIAISNANVIKALKNLCQRDDQSAQIVLRLLATSLANNSTDGQLQDLNDALAEAVTEVANNGRNITFGAAVLELAQSFKLPVTPQHVESVAQLAKGLRIEPLGLLALEKALREVDDVGSRPSGKKKRKSLNYEDDDASPENAVAIRMIDLFRSFGAVDAMLGLANQQFKDYETFKRGLAHDSLLQYDKSREMYRAVLEEDESNDDSLRLVFKEFYFQALENLSKWHQILDEIDVPGAFDTLTQVGFNRNTLLPLFVQACLFKVFEPSNDDKFNYLGRLSGLFNRPSDDANFSIKDSFGLELTIVFLLVKRPHDAEFHFNKALTRALSNWTSMTDLNANQLRESIMDVKRLTHIETILKAAKSKSSLQALWSQKSPSQASGILSLQDIDILLRDLRVGLRLTRELRGSRVSEQLAVTAKNYLNAGDQALETSRRWDFAVRMLSLASVDINQIDKNEPVRSELDAEFQVVYSKATVAKCMEGTYQAVEIRFNALYRGLMSFEQGTKGLEGNHSVQFARGKIVQSVVELIRQIEATGVSTAKGVVDLLSAPDKKDHLMKIGARMSRSVKELCEHLAWNNINAYGEHDESLFTGEENMTLAEMGYKFLEEFPGSKHGESVTLTAVKHHLLALKLGQERARDLFPNILELLEGQSGNLAKLFTEKIEGIEAWNFLPWTNQLISQLTVPAVRDPVKKVLMKLASEYPQALKFPYKVSTISNPHGIDEDLEKLLALDELDSKFAKALKNVCIPEVAILDLLTNCKDAKNKKEVAAKVRVYHDLVKEDKEFYGPFHQIAVNQYTKIILAELTKCSDLRNCLDKLTRLLRDAVRMYKKKPTIGDLVPWLEKFHMTDQSSKIEIPGQYLALTAKPDPTSHVKVSHFSEKLLIFSSLRKPIRLTMIGDDGRKYHFIVKCGEDLRQDERIEQAFRVANKSLRSIGGKVRTYNVIPLSTECGVIECLDEVVPYKSLAAQSLPSACSGDLKSFLKNITDDHDSRAKSFRSAVVKNSRYNRDVLRSNFEKLSISSEGFFFLRDNFIRSHATHCVLGWLLGIGDRHADNLLVSTVTGESIPIDFGYAFGAAFFLPVIELTPFRYTPQMRYLNSPFTESNQGPIREVMIRTLQALRRNSGVLMAALKVFVREPTIDWTDLAVRSANVSSLESNGSSSLNSTKDEIVADFPAKKIEVIKDKLVRLRHPVKIVMDEIRASCSRKEIRKNVDKLEEVLYGEEDSLRSRLRNKELLNEEETIDCLLEAATDPGILKCSYVGWGAIH